MGLDEIREIKQTSDEAVVNEHLNKGFRLVKIISGKIIIDGRELVQPVYILAIGEKD